MVRFSGCWEFLMSRLTCFLKLHGQLFSYCKGSIVGRREIGQSHPPTFSPPVARDCSFSCDVTSEIIVSCYNTSNYKGCKHSGSYPFSQEESRCKKTRKLMARPSSVQSFLLLYFLPGGFVVWIILHCFEGCWRLHSYVLIALIFNQLVKCIVSTRFHFQ